MSEIEELFPDGFIELDSDVLLSLAIYALEKDVIAATSVRLQTEECAIKIVEPDYLCIEFTPRFGLYAKFTNKAQFEQIKRSYFEVDYELIRLCKVN